MNKIINYSELPKLIDRVKSQGTLTLVGGCFDILHPGHIKFLTKAKDQGDILLVMLESDESVKAQKGASRPINSQNARAENLGLLSQVDYVLLLPRLKTDQEYYELVKKVQPDIIAVTASDPAYEKKSEQAKIVGGEIIEVIKRIPEHSTTKLINEV